MKYGIVYTMKSSMWMLVTLLILSACVDTHNNDSINNLEERVEKLEQENKSLKEQQPSMSNCEPDYALSLDNSHCVKVPDHAHAVDSATDVWLCDEGYVEDGNKCIQESLLPPPVTKAQAKPKDIYQVPTLVAPTEQNDTFPAYGQVMCVPTRGVFCSGGDCVDREPTVGLVIDLDSNTTSRCDSQGCDTYNVVFDKSGIFLNIRRPYQGGWNVKINVLDMTYTEVAELLLDQYISYGVCRKGA